MTTMRKEDADAARDLLGQPKPNHGVSHLVVTISAIDSGIEVETLMRVRVSNGHYHLPVEHLPFNLETASEIRVEGQAVKPAGLRCYQPFGEPGTYIEVG